MELSGSMDALVLLNSAGGERVCHHVGRLEDLSSMERALGE